MEQLALHIEYLLLRRDCVIVPGLGAFINVRKAAYFNVETEMWHPMTREVRFNRLVAHDDGLLANSYMRKYSLSFADARILLETDIKELRRLLNVEGEVTLGALGRLTLNEENVLFTPFQKPEQASEEMGYVKVPENLRTNKNQQNTDENVLPVGVRKLDFERNYYLAINKTFAKVAACVMVILLVGLSIVLPSSVKCGEDRASVVPFNCILALNDSDSANETKNSAYVRESQNQIKNTESAEKTNCEVNETVETTTLQSGTLEPQEKYYLIVATFSSATEAERYISINRNIGYDLEILPSKTLTRVSAKSSSDRNEIISELNSTKFRSTIGEGWIMKK